MRCLKISFNILEDKAGTILADLVENGVANLEFHVVADVPSTRDKPPNHREMRGALTPSRAGKTTGKSSVIPGVFAKELGNANRVTVQGIKTILAKNKMSPNSYTHAINVLKVAGMIRATNDRGLYEVVK